MEHDDERFAPARPRGRRAFAVLGAACALAGLAVALPAAVDGASGHKGERAVAARSLGSGSWCWFGDPRAVYYEGRRRQTYVGWVDPAGNIKLLSYDHDRRTQRVTTLHRRLQGDDHASPAVVVRRDRRIAVFYSPHGGPSSRMYYRVTRLPEDTSAWTDTRTVTTNSRGNHGYVYPNPLYVGGRLHLFWRGGNLQPTFARMQSRGRRWSRARTLISVPENGGRRPYVKYEARRGTVHFAFNEGNPATFHNSLYYAAYRRGSLRRADGRRIGALRRPLSPRRADLVWRGTRGTRAWVYDIAVDREGRPVIVYVRIRRAARLHEYRYARWNGHRWTDDGMVTTTPLVSPYSGGISLDHEEPERVYLSRVEGGAHEVEIWQTADAGLTWARHPLTTGSREDNIRPVSPRRFSTGEMGVIWLRGRYPSFTSYATRVTAATLRQLGARARARAHERREIAGSRR